MMGERSAASLFAEGLQQALTEQNMGTAELAAEMGAPPQLVEDWLTGKAFPWPSELAEVARILKCLPSSLSPEEMSLPENKYRAGFVRLQIDQWVTAEQAGRIAKLLNTADD